MPEEGTPSPFGGMRMWLIIGGVAIIAFFFLKSKSSSQSAGSPTTTGGGGTITSSGTTTLQKGAVTVTVTQQPQTAAAAGGAAASGSGAATGGTSSGNTQTTNASNPQPQPPTRDRDHTTAQVSNVIPKVTGQSFAQAKAALENAGFNVGGGAVQKNYSASTIITSQTPASGTTETQGRSQYWGANSSKPTVDLG